MKCYDLDIQTACVNKKFKCKRFENQIKAMIMERKLVGVMSKQS